MLERTPLFLALTRPTKYLGLPIEYLVILASGVVIPFMWTQKLIVLFAGVPVYIVLWFAADREPNFFAVMRVSFGTMARTKNRMIWGGDSYGPE